MLCMAFPPLGAPYFTKPEAILHNLSQPAKGASALFLAAAPPNTLRGWGQQVGQLKVTCLLQLCC